MVLKTILDDFKWLGRRSGYIQVVLQDQTILDVSCSLVMHSFDMWQNQNLKEILQAFIKGVCTVKIGSRKVVYHDPYKSYLFICLLTYLFILYNFKYKNEMRENRYVNKKTIIT